jgi:hypothetical protein
LLPHPTSPTAAIDNKERRIQELRISHPWLTELQV